MTMATTKVEPWKIDEVRKYLEKMFREARIDEYPKGMHAAHLFLVLTQRLNDRHRVAHQLLITRQFFDRFTDNLALRQALVTADVESHLKRAGERTVELY
ncbi:MAG: hypothetical protein ACRELA_23880 [Candidatus Rokuibacteriota bacterium]